MSTDIDFIDALVKRADPVDPLSLPGPDSPVAEDIWERVQAAASSPKGTPPLSRPRPGQAWHLVVPAIGVGALLAAILLVLQLLPTPSLRVPTAEAAVLRHLAGEAAAEPTPVLKSDEWLRSESRVSYLVAPPHGGPESAAPPSARAVLTVNAEEWSNDLGQYCSRQVVVSWAYRPANPQASPGQFGEPSSPQSQCGIGFLGLGGQAPGALDVARLPTDPTALAQELETGSTGIPALDASLPGHLSYLTPFGRAVTLLVGPTLGATPALWSALLRAMATMPGVAFLGTATTHSGDTGVALAGATGEGYRTTIVLSPSTGALLEAKNLLDLQLLAGLPSIGVVAIQWLDPVGIPEVVPTSLLPSSLAGQVPTGIVSAVTNPGVALDRWNAWLRSVLPELPGHSSAAAAATGTPGAYDVSVVTHSPDPDVARISALFRASGLFHGIRSATG